MDIQHDDEDRDDGCFHDEWCRDVEGHMAAHDFCNGHQMAWCRTCEREGCPECAHDPLCPDCGCSIYTEDHDWDCLYAN